MRCGIHVQSRFAYPPRLKQCMQASVAKAVWPTKGHPDVTEIKFSPICAPHLQMLRQTKTALKQVVDESEAANNLGAMLHVENN